MIKYFLFKLKFRFHTKLINRLVNFIVLLLRNDISKDNKIDEKTDAHLRTIALKELFPNISSHFEDEDTDEKLINEISINISKNTREQINKIKNDNSIYIRVFDNIQDYYFDDDIEISDIYNVVDVRDKINNIYIKSLKTLIGNYDREIKSLQNKISDKNAVKYQFKFESFSKAFTIGTPTLILGGIFKQYLISRDLSFPLPTVFSINDYLSASIDTIIFAIVPTIFLLIGSYIGLHENSRVDFIRKKESKTNHVIFYINLLILLFATIFTYFKNIEGFYNLLPLAGFYLMIILLPKLMNRYIKYDFNLIILIMSIMFFFLNIYSYTKSELYKIKSNTIVTQFEFKYSQKIDNVKNLRYVTSGANYYVFWNSIDSTTVLIKKDIVNIIEIKKNVP
jgi:hypothetical protein